jgi:CHAT domain-containing protein
MNRHLYPKDHHALAVSLNNLGMLLQARGDLAGAEPLYRDALAMRRRLHPNDHPGLAVSLNNLGGLLQARGDLAGAEPLYRDALAMRRRLHPKDHPDLAQSLSNLGSLLQDRGDLAGAEPLHRDVLAMCQRVLLNEAVLLPEADALNLAASFPASRSAFLSVTSSRADDPTAYDLIWQGRSAVTRLIEQRHRDLLASNNPDTRELGDKLLSARQRLSHVLLTPAQGAAKHAAAVQKLTQEKEDLEKELAQKLRLDLPPTDPPPPERLAELLPAGAAFLDFYRYTHFEFDPKVKGKRALRRTPHYVAFVLGKDRPAVRVELSEAAPLEKAWAAWHRAINKSEPADKERAAAAALAKLVWDPLRAKLPPGVRTLYLAPDGALAQIPWAALPGAKPGTVLLEDCAVATVPHGPFLLERLTAKAQARPGGGALLAVGGVDYRNAPASDPGDPARRDLEFDTAPAKGAAALPAEARVSWSKLPGTDRERVRVAALAEKYAGAKARSLTGQEATTARVFAELPKARFAHLATHGFFADAKFLSAFQVDPEEFASLDLPQGRRGGARSPLVLSGLVFAGANRQGKEADRDRGILTAEGIVGLRLDKLELAVLSACDTGLGEVGGGEGVYGLQRAFHIAGCKDVIASLWSVEDESTAALMTLFYTNLWVHHDDPLQALRKAQLYLYRNPGQIKSLARRDFEEVLLPRVGAAPNGPRARTAQWAAFTFSGVVAPHRADAAPADRTRKDPEGGPNDAQ